jgi:hypothetical protein
VSEEEQADLARGISTCWFKGDQGVFGGPRGAKTNCMDIYDSFTRTSGPIKTVNQCQCPGIE